MDKEKYKNLIETLPKESEELWFEYNLEVNKILQENQKLETEKEQLNSLVNGCQEEIRRLKKQLTTYQILHRDCKVDNLKNISKIEEMENQQKEFIEYLEEKEKEFDILGDPKNAGACKGILRKYREIIGSKE